MKPFDIKKTRYLGLLAFVVFLITTVSSAYAAKPVLFFSDLDSGPKTGWENASTKGAAVSVWGLNFGAAGPDSKITVAGQDILSTDSQFVAEWNAAAIARGMKVITFWLKPTCNDGAGTITVTTPEGQSNALSFTVRAGNIYYATPTGSDSNNGRTTGSAWRNAFKGLSMAPGDILYLRQGVYATGNSSRAYIWMDNEHGTAGKPLAWVSYPAEVATIGDGTLASGFGQYNYTGHGDNHDITIAKIKFNATEGGVTSGQSETPWYNFRVIANDIQNATKNSWGGAIYFAYFWNVKIYGNYLNNNGFDKYDHSIYINSYPVAGAGFDSHDLDIGWNEITHQNNGSNIKLHPKDSGTVAKLYNIYVHDNYIHDSPNESFELGARAGYVAIYNNLVVNTGTGAAGYNGGVHLTYQSSGSNPVVKIYNNTFINTGINSSFTFTDGATTNVDVRNNVFYDPVPRNFLDAGGWAGTATATNNYYFNFIPPSWDASPVSGDASFISGTDFRLHNNSQLIDAGVDVGAVVSSDYDGNPRPKYGRFDIGAFEYTVFSPKIIK